MFTIKGVLFRNLLNKLKWWQNKVTCAMTHRVNDCIGHIWNVLHYNHLYAEICSYQIELKCKSLYIKYKDKKTHLFFISIDKDWYEFQTKSTIKLNMKFQSLFEIWILAVHFEFIVAIDIQEVSSPYHTVDKPVQKHCSIIWSGSYHLTFL